MALPDSTTLPQAQATGPLPPGTVIGAKYEVRGPIGEGGMGFVVRARHLTLQEEVAIKFLKPAGGGTEAIERFVREARAAAKLKNEHVIRVHDVGVHEGMPYIVMELVAGQSLGDRVDAEGPLPPDLAVDLVLQACDAMADAHAHGIVHRDLKSGNLMLTQRGDGTPFVKILDFGLATAPLEDPSGPRAAGITSTNTTFGSPAYMPPEQIRAAKNADARSDLWALGVILYELVSGRLPFEADTVPGILAAIAADPPRPLAEVRPEAAALWPVVERCLRKDPAERFASVNDLAAALAPFASADGSLFAARAQRPRGSTPAPPAPSPSAPNPRSPVSGHTSTMAASADTFTPPAPPRGRTWLAVPAVAVVAVVATLGVTRLLSPRPDARPAAPTIDTAAITSPIVTAQSPAPPRSAASNDTAPGDPSVAATSTATTSRAPATDPPTPKRRGLKPPSAAKPAAPSAPTPQAANPPPNAPPTTAPPPVEPAPTSDVGNLRR